MNRTLRTFTLHVVPKDDGAYFLELHVVTNDRLMTVATLTGGRLERLRPAVVTAVTASKHARTVVSPTRKASIPLTEDAGVRLALTMLATAPLTKASRVEALRIGIDSMTSEEALYWYAYCTGPNDGKALQAIRTLLA